MLMGGAVAAIALLASGAVSAQTVLTPLDDAELERAIRGSRIAIDGFFGPPEAHYIWEGFCEEGEWYLSGMRVPMTGIFKIGGGMVCAYTTTGQTWCRRFYRDADGRLFSETQADNPRGPPTPVEREYLAPCRVQRDGGAPRDKSIGP